MKKKSAFLLSLAALVALLVAFPATAQEEEHRSMSTASGSATR